MSIATQPVERRRDRFEIERSWMRCAAIGLSANELHVPHSSAIDLGSQLVAVATPILESLASALSDEPICIGLSDDSGAVISRYSDSGVILRALDRVDLVPGAVFAEDAVGTNGFGLALAENRLALVAGPDHYAEALSAYTCAASPIHDRDGTVVGALSLTTWSSEHHDLLLALTHQTAMNVESALRSSVDAAHQNAQWSTIERAAIVRCLERNGGSVPAAALELGISKATLYRRIRSYEVPAFR